MGIETSVAKRKEKECCELDREKNPILNTNPNPKAHTNSRGKKGWRRQPKKAAAPLVQKLYDTCKEVFSSGGSGIVPSPDKIEKLRTVLDEMKPEDVGLSPEMPYFRWLLAGRKPRITYLQLHECDKFSIGIFCFPPSGVIPLHNHPGMTVFSKLLFGKMHIKSFDWVVDAPPNGSPVVGPSEVTQQPEGVQSKAEELKLKQSEAKLPNSKQPPMRVAKVKIDSDFTAPCNPTILYPADGGNMHCFTAATPCAVLDVLGPPYSDPDGRHCTYYRDFPFPAFTVDGVSVLQEEKEGYAWLQEREKQPDDFVMVGELYRGPKIVEK